jgi:hypothetical protein
MARETNNLKYTINDLNVQDMGNFYWTLQAVKKDRRGTIISASKKIKSNFNIDLINNPSKIIIISPELQVVPDGQNK